MSKDLIEEILRSIGLEKISDEDCCLDITEDNASK